MIAELIPKIAAMTAEDHREYRPRPSLIRDRETRCLRQFVYHALGVERQPMPGRAILTMDDSSWHEELTNDWLRQSALTLHSEQMEVECFEVAGQVVKGHIDGIVTDPAGQDFLFEHKALNHFSWQRYAYGDAIPDGYIGQCCAYLRGLMKVQPEMDEAVLLLKNKNTAQYVEFLIWYDPEGDVCEVQSKTLSTGETTPLNLDLPMILTDAVSFFEEVERRRSEKVLPVRPFPYGTDFPCGYCGWEGVCWEGYDAELAAMAKGVALDGEWEALCREYAEHSRTAKDHEKIADEAKARLAARLRDAGIAGGRAGAFSITRALRRYTSVDKDKVPPEILKDALRVTTSEVLTIRETKGGNGKTKQGGKTQ